MRQTSIVAIAAAALLLTASPSWAEDELNPAAMAKAKLSLDVAVGNAVTGSPGYRAVSAMPTLQGDKPVVVVTLMKGQDVKRVNEKLD